MGALDIFDMISAVERGGEKYFWVEIKKITINKAHRESFFFKFVLGANIPILVRVEREVSVVRLNFFAAGRSYSPFSLHFVVFWVMLLFV